MKRNKFFIKPGGLSVIFIILCAGIFSSCLKDKAPGNENYSHSPALVSFQYNGFSAIPFTASVLGTPEDTLGIEVTLSVASLTLNAPVTATIAVDPEPLATYNADTTTATYPTVFTELSPDLYTLDNGGKVTINPGQQKVNFTIHFAGDKIDFTQDNAVSLKITSATGATIATNLNSALILIKLRSIYEGSYANDGSLTRFNGATEGSGVRDMFPIAGTTAFSTVSVNEIDGGLSIPGFSAVNFTLTVNPDMSVTIGPSISNNTGDVENTPGKASTYDPATMTFDIHGGYLNSAGALREFDATLQIQ